MSSDGEGKHLSILKYPLIRLEFSGTIPIPVMLAAM